MNRIPPQNTDLESIVLGSVLMKPDILIDVADLLNSDTFYKESHQEIYKAILSLWSNEKKIDIVTVVERLKVSKKLSSVGGAHYMSTLIQRIASTSNVIEHVQILKQKEIARKQIVLGNELISKGYDDSIDPLETNGFIADEAYQINNLIETNRDYSNKELIAEVTKKIELASTNQGITGMQTGFDKTDKITGGYQKGNLIIKAGRPGMGKSLREDELIKIPYGNVKIKDLKIGDDICGTDGNIHKVTGYFPQGIRQMYEITFDDGLKVEADGGHLWEVQDRYIRKKGSNDVRVITTHQIMSEGLYIGDSNRKNFSLKYTKPVHHAKKELKIPPYILGLLIGDGSMTNRKFKFSNTEHDIIEKMRNHLGAAFKTMSYKDHNLNKSYLNKEIFNLGLFGKRSYEKFIPEKYLYSSIEDRIQLLRGLIDTDGHVVQGVGNYIEYSTTSKELKNDVLTLVRGLGGRCSFTERMGKYSKNGEYIQTRINYRIWIKLPKTIIPVSSEKHLKRYNPNSKFHKRFITKIEPTTKQKAICIKVNSPDECFLMNDYLVTHNTAHALCEALNASVNFGKRVLFFSLEMSATELMQRLITIHTEIEADKINKGTFLDEDWDIYNSKINAIINAPLKIIDDVGTLRGIQVKCKKENIKNGVDAIYVDYIQLISNHKKGENREREISDISRTLKLIAKELDVPVIALSQLNRSVESRGGDKKPMLSDLRESGAIEQDADIVSFMYRPEYYGITEDAEGNSLFGKGYLLIAKHRGGALRDVEMNWLPKITKFTENEPSDFTRTYNQVSEPNKFIEPNTEFDKEKF